jgi:hypothetical protein
MEEGDGKKLRSALDLYFMEPDGSTFKVTKPMFPYFYLAVKDNHLREVEGFLRRRFDKLIEEITPTDRVDLEMVCQIVFRRIRRGRPLNSQLGNAVMLIAHLYTRKITCLVSKSRI